MEYLESQLRQKFASVVWTHKIQEKQADYYKRLYNIMETVRIILSAITTSGIISSIFVDKTWLKVITAIISMGTLFISTYLKSYDLKGLHQKHKETAIQLLDLREEIISVLCDIKWKKIDEEQLADKRDEINTKYSDICKGALDANNFAVKKASKALRIYKDNTYTDEEINSYLPVELRKKQKDE